MIRQNICVILVVLLPMMTACRNPDIDTGIKYSLSLQHNPPVDSHGFVAKHGFLQAKKSRLLDQNGDPIQLRGMSLFWSNWMGQYFTRGVVQTLRKEWKSRVIRAALGVDADNGYLSDREGELAKISTVVEESIAQDIYVIIDWHSHTAQNQTEEAQAFFGEMAERYGNTPHVIFEIYNEPKNVAWPEVKKYSEAVIGTIRQKNAKNLILIGTPHWSRDVDVAAQDPLSDSNIAYVLHFYAASDRQELRDKASYAMSKGITLFVTEFAVCTSTGNGPADYREADLWMKFMDDNLISWTNWAISDKVETASALRPGASVNGGWKNSELTESGLWIRSKIQAAIEP